MQRGRGGAGLCVSGCACLVVRLWFTSVCLCTYVFVCENLRAELAGPTGCVGLSGSEYVCVFVWLACSGPGRPAAQRQSTLLGESVRGHRPSLVTA